MYIFLEIIYAIFALVYYLIEALVVALTPASWKMKDVSDDIVLITGAGSGIGRLLAKQFARLGSKVVLVDVNKEGNRETHNMIRQTGGKSYPYECDITNKDAVYELAKKIKEQVGKVTILINNAGVVTGKPLLDSPDHMIQRTFAVNILAHFWTVKAFLPDMLLLDRGHIVSIASLAGLCGANRMSDYCASKFAVVGFDESLRMELKAEGRKNIHTTIVCPYFINTGMFDGVRSKILPVLTPEDVANAIVDGILTNAKMLMIPKYIFGVVFLKMILPFKATNLLANAFGFSTMMDCFHGRNGK